MIRLLERIRLKDSHLRIWLTVALGLGTGAFASIAPFAVLAVSAGVAFLALLFAFDQRPIGLVFFSGLVFLSLMSAGSAELLGSVPATSKYGAFLLFGVVPWVWPRASGSVVPRPFWFGVALFSGVQIAASASAGWPERSIEFLVLWAVIVVVLVGFRRRRPTSEHVVGLVAIGVVAYWTLVLSTLLGGVAVKVEPGFFGHPNGFAISVLITSMFLFWAIFMSHPSLLVRIGSWVGALILPIVLFISSSRSTLLSALMFVATLAAFRLTGWARRSLFVLGSVGFFSILAYVQTLTNAEFNDLIFDLFGKRPETGRIALWLILLSAVRIRPLLGYGPGGSAFVVAEDHGMSAHSVYLQVLVDSGFLGLVSFAVLLLGVARLGFSLKSIDRSFGHSLIALVLALFVGGLFEVAFLGNFFPGTYLFWLIVGLAVASHNSRLPHEGAANVS